MSKSNFPSILDTFTKPTNTSLLSGADGSHVSHADQHEIIIDALKAIQTTIGITDSSDINSISFKLKNHTHSWNEIELKNHTHSWNEIENQPSFSYAPTSGVASTAATLDTGNWEIVEVSGTLHFRFAGQTKATLDSFGNFAASGDIVGFNV